MKSYREELWFEIPARRGMVNITPEVERCLRESGVTEGLVRVTAMHITASVFINDDESGLHHDYERWLEGLAPHAPTRQSPHWPSGRSRFNFCPALFRPFFSLLYHGTRILVNAQFWGIARLVDRPAGSNNACTRVSTRHPSIPCTTVAVAMNCGSL